MSSKKAAIGLFYLITILFISGCVDFEAMDKSKLGDCSKLFSEINNADVMLEKMQTDWFWGNSCGLSYSLDKNSYFKDAGYRKKFIANSKKIAPLYADSLSKLKSSLEGEFNKIGKDGKYPFSNVGSYLKYKHYFSRYDFKFGFYFSSAESIIWLAEESPFKNEIERSTYEGAKRFVKLKNDFDTFLRNYNQYLGDGTNLVNLFRGGNITNHENLIASLNLLASYGTKKTVAFYVENINSGSKNLMANSYYKLIRKNGYCFLPWGMQEILDNQESYSVDGCSKSNSFPYGIEGNSYMFVDSLDEAKKYPIQVLIQPIKIRKDIKNLGEELIHSDRVVRQSKKVNPEYIAIKSAYDAANRNMVSDVYTTQKRFSDTLKNGNGVDIFLAQQEAVKVGENLDDLRSKLHETPEYLYEKITAPYEYREKKISVTKFIGYSITIIWGTENKKFIGDFEIPDQKVFRSKEGFSCKDISIYTDGASSGSCDGGDSSQSIEKYINSSFSPTTDWLDLVLQSSKSIQYR
jgi:hypothetical protein